MKNTLETVIELDRTSLPARRAMKVTRHKANAGLPQVHLSATVIY